MALLVLMGLELVNARHQATSLNGGTSLEGDLDAMIALCDHNTNLTAHDVTRVTESGFHDPPFGK